MEKKYRHVRNALVGAALVFTAQLQAATLTDTFTVTATVNASCAMTADDIVFGNWDPLSGDASSTGTVSVACSNGLPYSVAIDQGSNYSGFDCTAPARRMGDGFGNYLDYGLYLDAGHAQPWGCDSSNDADGTGIGSTQLLTVHGSLPAAQSVTSGVYTDSLVATIIF